MSDDYLITELAESRARVLAAVPPGPLLAALRARGDELGRLLVQEALARIPAFGASRNPDMPAQAADHGARHAQEIVRLLAGGAFGGFEFVREHARLRAGQRFPLEAMLHAYRLGQRLTTRWLKAAAAEAGWDSPQVDTVLTEFAIEYTDAISTIASQAYAEQTRLMAEAAVDRQAMLMNLLLDGYDEADPKMAAMLRAAGLLDGRQNYCVAMARPVVSAEMANPERARRLAAALDALVPPALARRLVDVRGDVVVAVYCAERRVSGFSAPAGPLAPRLAAALAGAGPAVLIGLSDDVGATVRIPAAHRQATLALARANVAQRVVGIADLPLASLAVQLAGEPLRDLLPDWAGALRDADVDAGGALASTLATYADADMNALKAAARLAIHPNTLHARLHRIRSVTGLDPRRYRSLAELLLVLDALRPN